MKSLAIWCEKSGDDKPEIDIHLNFWKLPKHKNFSFDKFLDIGLDLKDASSIKKVHIYFPFKVVQDDISDLGEVICDSNNGNLLSAIFNELYKVTTDSKSNYHQILDSKDKEVFNIYTLDTTSDIELKNEFKGSIVTIKLPDRRKKKTYIRLRFRTKSLEEFSSIETNPISLLNSAFTKIEIFDFRINSLRHLPTSLNQKLAVSQLFSIAKIHFFYICSYRENYLLSHTPFFGARKLEQDIWDEYISNGSKKVSGNSETVVAYHWSKTAKKEDKSLKHFNVLMKTEFRHNNWRTILKYLLFTLLFGIVVGVSANFSYDKLKGENTFSKKSEMSVISDKGVTNDQRK